MIVLLCLLLAGCTSANNILVGTYVVSFTSISPPNATNPFTASNGTAVFSPLEIRASYFGLCARDVNRADWSCGNHLGAGLLNTPDPWNLRKTAEDYRTRVISPILMCVLPSCAPSLISSVVGSLTTAGQYRCYCTELDVDTPRLILSPCRKRRKLDDTAPQEVLGALDDHLHLQHWHGYGHCGLATRGGGDRSAVGRLHVFGTDQSRRGSGGDSRCLDSLLSVARCRRHVFSRGIRLGLLGLQSPA